MVGSYVTGRNTKERRWNRQEVVWGRDRQERGISMETQFVGVYEDNNTANFLGPSCFYQPQCRRPLSLLELSFSIDYT